MSSDELMFRWLFSYRKFLGRRGGHLYWGRINHKAEKAWRRQNAEPPKIRARTTPPVASLAFMRYYTFYSRRNQNLRIALEKSIGAYHREGME